VCVCVLPYYTIISQHRKIRNDLRPSAFSSFPNRTHNIYIYLFTAARYKTIRIIIYDIRLLCLYVYLYIYIRVRLLESCNCRKRV